MATAKPNPLRVRPAGSQPRRAGRALTPEALRAGSENELARQLGAKLESCSKHAIEYYVFEAALNQCPACTLEDKVTGLEIEVTQLKNALTSAKEENGRLLKVSNMIVSMRDAAGLMDLEDLAWVKGVMYRWRTDRSVKLRAIHDTKREHPVGLMAVPKKGDPEARECSSFGGIALAGFVEEASQSHGPEEAMSMLARAMHAQLKGGLG